MIELVNHDKNSELVKLTEDKAIVLNFWNPEDPQSRIRNKMIHDLMEENNEEFIFLSVCTSNDNKMETAIMKTDDMAVSDNVIFYSLPDVSPQFLKNYKIEKGNMTFIIDSKGVLKEKIYNPNDLKMFFSQFNTTDLI